MRGQVKYSVVLDNLMFILNPLLKRKLFMWKNLSKELGLMKWLTIQSLSSIHLKVTVVLKLAMTLFKTYPASIFNSLITLIKLVAESLAFLM